MASHDELKSALMETLEKRGVVGELKAKIRQEIFSVLDENDVAKPKLPMETVVVNEAIREYLEYNSYHHTLSVFLAESGQGKQTQFDKKLLLDELRLDASETQNLPCLYSLVCGLRSQMPIHQDVGSRTDEHSVFRDALGEPIIMSKDS